MVDWWTWGHESGYQLLSGTNILRPHLELNPRFGDRVKEWEWIRDICFKCHLREHSDFTSGLTTLAQKQRSCWILPSWVSAVFNSIASFCWVSCKWLNSSQALVSSYVKMKGLDYFKNSSVVQLHFIYLTLKNILQ